MKTITIKNLTIQVDIPKAHGDMVADACTVIDEINKALQEAGLNCQPQIFYSGIDSSDIEVNEPEEEEEEEVLEPTVKLTSVSGKNCFEVPESNKNTLVDMNLVHYDGVKWLYFDEEWELVSEAIKNMK